MTKRNIKTRAGFTIIEVVLVLAIAGLIFMMVFIALPALQRSQRDTQRNNDIGRLQSALNNFQASNRNAIPSDGGETSILGHYSKQPTGTYDTGSWGYFYDNYLLVGSGGANDRFEDPDGSAYGFIVRYCSATGTLTNPSAGISNGQNCQNGVQRATVSFDAQSEGIDTEDGIQLKITDAVTTDDTSTEGHSIGIVLGAICQGETVVASSGARKVAMIYKKEGGGVICLNN